MLRITLPSGIVVETDSAVELESFLDTLKNLRETDKRVVHARPKIEPDHVPALPNVIATISNDIEKQESFVDYPHKYATGKRGINIGERENQVLVVAKMFAEEAKNRAYQFKTREIWEMVDDAPTMSTISSALQSLYSKRLVAHGKSNRRWWVTDRGWNSNYRIIAPMLCRERVI